MGLGELPARTTMRAYYKLENVNDSSGNSATLTNIGSLTFAAAKFGNGLNTAGVSAKGLTRTTNILSASAVPNITVSFWFRLTNTANVGVARRFFEIIGSNGSSSATYMACYFGITLGVLRVGVNSQLTGVTCATVTSIEAANTTKWYHAVVVKSETTTLSLYINGKLVNSATGTGTDTATGTTGTYKMIVGNAYTLTYPSYGVTDEMIIEERVWSASEVRKYYNQAKGRTSPR